MELTSGGQYIAEIKIKIIQGDTMRMRFLHSGDTDELYILKSNGEFTKSRETLTHVIYIDNRIFL